MKRLISSGLAIMAFLSLQALTTPAVFPGGGFKSFSPNGEYAIQDPGDHSPLVIMDLNNAKDYTYSETYETGQGNCVSNTGVVVGNTLLSDKASYWQNGAWKLLSVPFYSLQSFANGITPDGKMIVGNITPDVYVGDYEGTYLVPVYWELGADGKYAGPYSLPYPTMDFTNRNPQKVTAIRVSDDGNTIAGQMLDYKGQVNQPVIFQRGQNGEWTYSLLLDELFHPEGVPVPVYPGEAPRQQQFMTQQEIDAFNKAMEEWEQNTPDDYDYYPDIYKFMTQEERDAFYEADFIWQEEIVQFDIDLSILMQAVPNFDINNIFMTSDGSLVASTDAKFYMDEAQGINFKEFVPYLIDVNSDTYRKFPAVDDVQIMISGLTDDGVLIGQNNNSLYGIYNGYILPAGKNEFIPLYDFVKEVDENTAAWMAENMTHTYDRYDFDNNKVVPTEILATGVPFTNPDMSLIGFAQYCFWDYTSDIEYYGYLISLPPYAGVEEIASDDEEVSIGLLPGGDLRINGEVNRLEVFAINGMKVYSADSPRGEISTNLSKGVYILKATTAAGNNYNKKIVIR